MGKLECHAAVGAHVAAKLAESMTYIGHGTGLVVGQAVHHHCRTANAIAFVATFDIVHTIKQAGAALDGVFDIVLRHRLSLGLVYGQTQTRVGAKIGPPHLGRDGDFLDQTGKDFAALGVLATFAVLNVRPLAVTSHVATS